MMGDTFRDVIADMFGTRDDPESRDRADGLLDTAAMVQIRNGLQKAYFGLAWNRPGSLTPNRRDAIVVKMEADGFDRYVIDWVLGDVS